MTEIGAALREARMRERIDVSEIEAQTKIRAKYLRALENEEWDLLPGPTFVKSFLRTYAQALGLDGRAMVEEYKLHYEHPGEGPEPERRAVASQAGQQMGSSPGPPPRSARRRATGAARGRGGAAAAPRQGTSRAYIATVSVVGAVIVLLVYALLSGGTKSPTTVPHTTGAGHGATVHRERHARSGPAGPVALASVRFEPTAEVYVCLVGDGRVRIPGAILAPGNPEPTYHARRFELTLGNNRLTLIVNGRPLEVPASSRAIGYAITHTGVRSLVEGEAPTCK